MGEIARRSIGNTRKKYSFYNTTNKLFTSKKSTSSSNASDAQLAIFLSKSHITSTTYFLVAQTESKTFNPKLFTFYGRRYLKNCNQKCVYQRTNLTKKVDHFTFESICLPMLNPAEQEPGSGSMNEYRCQPQSI